MNDSDPCPFCGGNKIKKLPLSDKVKKANASAGGNSGGIEIESNPDKEFFFKCNGCNFKFVDADRDIKGIMNNLKVGVNIAILIRTYYHENVSVTDLLTNHRVAIVRKPRNFLSFIANKVVDKEVIICFNYNGIRTFGSFVKEKDKEIGIYQYNFKTLGVP